MNIEHTVVHPTRKTGVMLEDDDGNEFAQTELIAGFHVSTPIEVPEWNDYWLTLDDYPSVPTVLYAGSGDGEVETYHYKFTDEQLFESLYERAVASGAAQQLAVLKKWRNAASAESAKLKYILAEDGILNIIHGALEQQTATVRALWGLNTWSRNNQTLIGMVAQMAALPAIGAVVLDVDVWMDSWFERAIALEV